MSTDRSCNFPSLILRRIFRFSLLLTFIFFLAQARRFATIDFHVENRMQRSTLQVSGGRKDSDCWEFVNETTSHESRDTAGTGQIHRGRVWFDLIGR